MTRTLSESGVFLRTQDGKPIKEKEVPDLTLAVAVDSSTDGVVVSTDGGVQVASNVQGLYAVVDIILYVDIVVGIDPETHEPIYKELSRRRVFAVNTLAPLAGLPNVANWSFSVVDHPDLPGLYTYSVKAQLQQSNFQNGVYVSGGPPSAPPLSFPFPTANRGTLTAVVINK
jgi:hypothetical protein